MIAVFKLVHDFYHPAVKLNLNAFSMTRGNKHRLQKYSCHYNITKGNGQQLCKEHCSVDVWNCLPSCVVSAPSLNSFKHNIKSVDFSKFLIVEV